jgi:predicted ATPase
MHISKIQLENIKSHVSSTFEFNRGTTAITGENGAGKTSIIEGVAWVLFDLLEYKKEDFVRRGAKKGSVTVTLESGLDEREYIVYRGHRHGLLRCGPAATDKDRGKEGRGFFVFSGSIWASSRVQILGPYSSRRSVYPKAHLPPFFLREQLNERPHSTGS